MVNIASKASSSSRDSSILARVHGEMTREQAWARKPQACARMKEQYGGH